MWSNFCIDSFKSTSNLELFCSTTHHTHQLMLLQAQMLWFQGDMNHMAEPQVAFCMFHEDRAHRAVYGHCRLLHDGIQVHILKQVVCCVREAGLDASGKFLLGVKKSVRI